MHLFYRLNKVATECLTYFTFENCGLEAADFLETLVLGQTPPICDQRTKKYITENPENCALCFRHSVWITVILCLCYNMIK